MKISHTVSETGKTAVINIYEPIETRNAGAVKALTETLADKGVSNMVFDAHGIAYISSDGFGVLLNMQRRLRNGGGKMILANPNNEVVSILSILGLTGNFIIAESVSQAVDTVEKGGTFSGSGISMARDADSHREKSVSRNESEYHSESFNLEDGEIVFEKPLIIECEQCAALTRVRASGRFMCPVCHAEFVADKNGTVIF